MPKTRTQRAALDGFITIRLPQDQIDQLETRAEEQERSLSAEVRIAVRAYLKTRPKAPA